MVGHFLGSMSGVGGSIAMANKKNFTQRSHFTSMEGHFLGSMSEMWGGGSKFRGRGPILGFP